MKTRAYLAVCSALLASGFPGCCWAQHQQQPGAGSSRFTDRWSVFGCVGHVVLFSRPEGPLERAMNAAGWGENVPLEDGQFLVYPNSSRNKGVWLLGLRCGLGSRLAGEIQVSRGPGGSVSGYRTPTETTGYNEMSIEYSASPVLGALGSFRSGPLGLRVALGPAGMWYTSSQSLARYWEGQPYQRFEVGKKRTVVFGILADAGFQPVVGSHLAGQVKLQYRWFPGSGIGPFDHPGGSFPAARISLSGFGLMLGLGGTW